VVAAGSESNDVLGSPRQKVSCFMVRCKFQLAEVHHFAHGTQKFVFRPNYDTSIPEDQRFAKASPSGEFNIFVDNPKAQEQFKVGEFYYFDASPVPAAS
jgi:hypothetical protein